MTHETAKTKLWPVCIAAALAVLVPGPTRAETGVLDGVDEYVNSALDEWDVPGASLAIVKDGQVVLVRGYGVTRVGESRSVDAHTVFPLASITKNFTATAVALLVEEGRLNWDDTVVKHLLGFEFSDEYRTRHTTIRDLLCHRTGLERGDPLPRRGDVSIDDVVQRVRFLQPVHGFRERWEYNNLMYYVAGAVVARCADTTWEEFVADRLLGPLEMDETFTSRVGVPAETSAFVHRLVDGKVVAADWTDRHLGVSPAGSMYSNAEDMAKWLLAALGGEGGSETLLKQSTRREMQSIQMSVPVTWDRTDNPYAARFYGWGLGWTVLDYRGRKLCYHAGSTGTMFAVVPEENLGVAVLTAMDWSNLPGMLMYDVIDAFLDGPKQAWDRTNWEFWRMADPHPDLERQKNLREAEAKRVSDTKPSVPLNTFAGRYECDLYGDLVVTHADGQLMFTFGRNGPSPLEHWDHDSFYIRSPILDVPTDDWLIDFEVKNGAAASLAIERIGWHEAMPRFHRVDESTDEK